MCLSNKILVSVVVIILLCQRLAESQGILKPRINNGYQCDTTKVPFFVIIECKIACGGILITYNWVLTGAHCIMKKFVEGVTVKVHSGYDRPSPELKQVRIGKEIHGHPNFNLIEGLVGNDYRCDIGLVLVDKPFHETSATRVATLPAPGFTKQCKQALAAGIGRTYDNENVWPVEKRPLMCVNLSIIDINTCEKNFSTAHYDTTSNICTFGEGIRGPCQGDSGGPLICDNVVIGIVSGGGNCSKRTMPTAYTMIESYLDFIDQHVKFTGIRIEHGPVNDTGGGGQKASDKSPANANNTHVHTNGTEGSGKKNSNKSPANMIQGPNWKLSFFTLLYLIVLCH